MTLLLDVVFCFCLECCAFLYLQMTMSPGFLYFHSKINCHCKYWRFHLYYILLTQFYYFSFFLIVMKINQQNFILFCFRIVWNRHFWIWGQDFVLFLLCHLVYLEFMATMVNSLKKASTIYLNFFSNSKNLYSGAF